MPQVSLRQQLVNAVKVRFQAIRQANGYLTETGANCFTFRDMSRVPAEDEALPLMSIRDTNCVSSQKVSKHHDHLLTIEVTAAMTGAPPDNAARDFLADLETAIGVDRQWEVDGVKLAKDTFPGEDEINVTHAEQRIAGVRKTFSIEFRTARFDPFNQTETT